jgi:hypothetical protein
MAKTTPIPQQLDLTIILEWENVLLSGNERCLKMLQNLGRQIEESLRTIEILVCYNPSQIAASQIETILSDHLALNLTRDEKKISLQLCAAEDEHYFALKNKGANLANGDIILYIDSDVIPEGNWLAEISEPFFTNPKVDVLAGNTYLSFQTLREKAFAVGWFFPLRNPNNTCHANATHFFANNVAFRKKTILDHPFPPMPEGCTRGSCFALARQLIKANIPIWHNSAARADHPAPTNLKHTIIRAFAEGRDYLLNRGHAKSSTSSVLTVILWSLRKQAGVCLKIKDRRKQAGLSSLQAMLAICIMTVYYQLAAIGGILTSLFPKYARSQWRI